MLNDVSSPKHVCGWDAKTRTFIVALAMRHVRRYLEVMQFQVVHHYPDVPTSQLAYWVDYTRCPPKIHAKRLEDIIVEAEETHNVALLKLARAVWRRITGSKGRDETAPSPLQPAVTLLTIAYPVQRGTGMLQCAASLGDYAARMPASARESSDSGKPLFTLKEERTMVMRSIPDEVDELVSRFMERTSAPADSSDSQQRAAHLDRDWDLLGALADTMNEEGAVSA